ncbi:MAG TPA: hypothetical protein VH301_00425, partial [Usitatibacter sp.]|nr:hypothetical protein [Usitatibacter sp.]
MKRNLIGAAVAGALALGGALAANAQDDYTYRIARAPEWNISAAEGSCRLRVWVDDKAQVQLRGDQIIVNTRSGKRSYDQGSVCTQPLPFRHVDNFHVAAAAGRGQVIEVHDPDRRNDFTGTFTVVDPQNGGDSYEVVVAWNNPEARVPSAPIALNDPYPYYDETRACQDRERHDFLSRNDVDAYLEFHELARREDLGGGRERIAGRGWARNRDDSRPITFECIVNDRTNRVQSANYDVRGPL